MSEIGEILGQGSQSLSGPYTYWKSNVNGVNTNLPPHNSLTSAPLIGDGNLNTYEGSAQQSFGMTPVSTFLVDLGSEVLLTQVEATFRSNWFFGPPSASGHTSIYAYIGAAWVLQGASTNFAHDSFTGRTQATPVTTRYIRIDVASVPVGGDLVSGIPASQWLAELKVTLSGVVVPTSPLLTAPLQATAAFPVSWTEVAGAVTYELEVDGVLRPAVAASGATVPVTQIPSTIMTRVRGINSAGTPGSWSNVCFTQAVRIITGTTLPWMQINNAERRVIMPAGESNFASLLVSNTGDVEVGLAYGEDKTQPQFDLAPGKSVTITPIDVRNGSLIAMNQVDGKTAQLGFVLRNTDGTVAV